MRLISLCIVLAMASVVWSQEPECALRARADLKTWYADRGKAPAYTSLIAKMDDDPADAQYLTALLRQLWQDELDGSSPRVASPFWGQGASQTAREYRQLIAAELGQNGHGPAALEPAEFLLGNDRLPDVQEAAVRVIHRVECERSSAEALRLVTQPHPNQGVLVTAIRIVGERGLRQGLPQLRELAGHHRAAVRQEACKAAHRLGLELQPDPPQVLNPELESQLKTLESMILYPQDSLPAAARWVHVTAPTGQLTLVSSWFGNEDLKEVSGWLLDEQGGRVHLLDSFGVERWLERSACQLQERSFEQELQALQAARLQSPDMLYQQFRPSWLTLPEASTAAWALARGQRRVAAALILPRLKETPDDRWLFWAARDLLGHRYHQLMLDAFCYGRDYAKAARLAHHLARAEFEGYVYHGRAQELEGQLQHRSDDFSKLQLPTPQSWQSLKLRLDRRAQLGYLADRLRLLTCHQWGQPGGISFSDQQSDRPEGQPDGHPVINPLTTLAEMKLTRSDCQFLLTYLEDRNFVLGYSFFRDFHPDRNMHRVSELVCLLFNQAAQKQLIQPEQLENPGLREAALGRARAWCEARP
ncbi:MAG: HEAT repeat domain-containing protein [Vulcanimicrobiota bacterium]